MFIILVRVHKTGKEAAEQEAVLPAEAREQTFLYTQVYKQRHYKSITYILLNDIYHANYIFALAKYYKVN